MNLILFIILTLNYHLIQCQYPGKEIHCNEFESFKINNNYPAQRNIDEMNFQADADINALKEVCFSFKQFMQLCLYDQNFGYYCTNSVKLGGHFFTYPMHMSPNFGAMIAYLAYGMWRSMILSKNISKQEIFTIFEFGGGNGILCRDILDSIEKYAAQEKNLNLKSNWTEFNTIVKYVMGEKSNFLIMQQQELNKQYIDNQKLKIINTDATKINNDVEKFKGLIISNELLDAFAVHKVLQKNNTINCCILLPTINCQIFSSLSKKEVRQIFIDNFKIKLLLKNIINKKHIIKFENQKDNTFKISHNTWYKLRLKFLKRNSCASHFDQNIDFQEYYIDHRYFTQAESYVKRNLETICKLEQFANSFLKDSIWYMNCDVESYIKNVTNILERGFVLTIDYGKDWSIHQQQILLPQHALRTYPKEDKFSNRFLYNNIGKIDMTTDVNFTDLALIGNQFNLKPVFYADQKNLSNNKMRISKYEYLTAFDLQNNLFSHIDDYEKFNKYKCFKMLIQEKNSSDNKFEILKESENLFNTLN